MLTFLPYPPRLGASLVDSLRPPGGGREDAGDRASLHRRCAIFAALALPSDHGDRLRLRLGLACCLRHSASTRGDLVDIWTIPRGSSRPLPADLVLMGRLIEDGPVGKRVTFVVTQSGQARCNAQDRPPATCLRVCLQWAFDSRLRRIGECPWPCGRLASRSRLPQGCARSVPPACRKLTHDLQVCPTNVAVSARHRSLEPAGSTLICVDKVFGIPSMRRAP